MAFNESDYSDIVLAFGDPKVYCKCERDLSGSPVSVNGGSLGTSYNATYVGNMDWKEGWIDQTDQAALFEDVTAYMNLGNIVNTSAPQSFGILISFEFWLRPANEPGSKQNRTEVFYSHSSPANTYNFVLGLDPSNRVTVTFRDILQHTSRTILQKDTWYHVVLTVNGGHYTLYVNGYKDSETKNLSFTTNLLTMTSYVGTYYKSGAVQNDATWMPYQGLIDEFAIYNTVLPETYVKKHFAKSDLYKLENLINSEHIKIQSKITMYEVEWAAPPMAITYKKAVISANPLLYWKFDGEFSLGCFNYGVRGATCNGVYYGTSPTLSNVETVDVTDSSVEFTGGTGHVRPASPLVYDNNTKATIECWAYLNETNSPDRMIVSKASGVSYDFSLHTVAIGPDTFQVQFKVKNGATVVTTTSASTLNINQFYHIVGVVDGTEHKLYINGVEDSATTSATLLAYTAGNALYIGNSYDGVATNNTGTLHGATIWRGYLDEFAFYNYAMSQLQIYEHFVLGNNGVVYEPEYDVDTAPVSSVASSTTYAESIARSDALHYWSMDETLSGVNTAFDDTGSAPNLVNLTYSDPTNVALQIDSPIRAYTHTYKFNDVKYAETTGAHSGLDLSAEARTPITLEFWYKRFERNDRPENLLGFVNGANTDWPIMIYVDKGWLGVYIESGGVSFRQLLYRIDTVDWRDENDWSHIVVSVSNYGNIKSWCNGVLKYSASTPDNLGIFTPSASHSFIIGKLTGTPFNDIEYCGVAGVAVYNKVLPSSDIFTRYNLGRYGTGFTKRVLTSAGATSGYYAASAVDYSYLKNGLDITPSVDSYTIETKLDTFVNGAVLSLKEGWRSTTLRTRFKPNVYITIEERYTNTDGDYDSGWISLGQFLNDGFLPTDYATNDKQMTLKLSTPMKLLTLDPMAFNLRPDVIDVVKDKLELYATTTDAYYFKRRRSPVPDGADAIDNYYYNWAENPAVRLYVSHFDQLYQGSDQAKITQDVDINEEFVIRGADTSVQVLGGEGTIVINKNFFDSTVPEGGLGMPRIGAVGTLADGVKADFSRYATQADVYGGFIGAPVQITNVTSIATTNDKWFLTFNQAIPDINGKTLFVKSGKAKGKIFRVHDPSNVAQSGATKEFDTASVGSTPTNSSVWVNPNNVLVKDSSYAEWDWDSTYAGLSNGNYSIQTPTLTARTLDTAFTIPSGATIKGIAIDVKLRKSKYVSKTLNPFTNIDVKTKLSSLRLKYGAASFTANKITSSTEHILTNELSISYQNAPGIIQEDYFTTLTFGSETDLWGYGSWTDALINGATNVDFGAELQFTCSFNKPNADPSILYAGEDLFPNPQVESITARIYYETVAGVSCYVTDLHNRIVNPAHEGLQQLDYVQVGDCNRLEDVLRKFFVLCGFQENDPTKPFYFEIDECLTEVLLPPLDAYLLDGVSKLDTLATIMGYAPPNYFVQVNLRNGHLRVKNVVLDDAAEVAHVLDYATEQSEETLDTNIYTKVIAQGQSGQSVNVGLHSDYGGQSAVRAYKLDNFATPLASNHTSQTNNGYTLAQADADDYIATLFDNNGKSPYITESGYDYVGVLYQKYGTKVRKIDMSETDLFVIDLGLNSASDAIIEYEIDALQLVWFNTYRQGTAISQSLYVYYMTEHDYISEFGNAPPTYPNQTAASSATTYMPPANAVSWKPLVVEFNVSEGQQSIESSDFFTKRPTKCRFLKFRVGQPHFRFALTTGDDTRYSRIAMSDIKVWTSNRIIASAELGSTYPFNTGNDKQAAVKYRRRTQILELNPYLDTYESTKAFAIDELKERRQDFIPIAVVCPNRLVTAGDIVSYLPVENYYNGEGSKKYIVFNATANSETNTNSLILNNYDIEE